MRSSKAQRGAPFRGAIQGRNSSVITAVRSAPSCASSVEETLTFSKPREFTAWLARHHTKSTGIWVRLAKKDAFPSITYAEALDCALCHGWIDARKRPESAVAWLQRFTPRRPRSIWSKRNREKADALIAAGRMLPAGLAEITRAKQDGRWDAAYDSPATATVPPDLAAALARNPPAQAFFETLDSANRYAVLWRVQTARRAATRAARIAKFVAMLANHEKLHP